MTDTQTAFVLAPREPDKGMLTAALRSVSGVKITDPFGYDADLETVLRLAIRSALSAAPKPPKSDPSTSFSRWVNEGPALAKAAAAEKSELRSLAKKLSTALVQLTPGGSEYYTMVGKEYYADVDTCVGVIRDKFTSGHQAKLDRVDADRRIKELEEALKPFADAVEYIGLMDGELDTPDWSPFVPIGAYRQAALAINREMLKDDRTE